MSAKYISDLLPLIWIYVDCVRWHYTYEIMSLRMISGLQIVFISCDFTFRFLPVSDNRSRKHCLLNVWMRITITITICVYSAALKQYMWTGWNSHNFSRSYILNVIIAENTTQLVPLTCLHADFVRYHNHINNDSACWAVCPTSYQMLAVRQFSCLPSEKRAEKKKKERFSYFNVFLCGQRSGNTGGK